MEYWMGLGSADGSMGRKIVMECRIVTNSKRDCFPREKSNWSLLKDWMYARNLEHYKEKGARNKTYLGIEEWSNGGGIMTEWGRMDKDEDESSKVTRTTAEQRRLGMENWGHKTMKYWGCRNRLVQRTECGFDIWNNKQLTRPSRI